MAVLDEDFGTGLTLVEGNGGVRSSPVLVPERAPRDWRSQCERERARADAAEARAEELRWAEVASRSDAGSWKSRFKACRHRLSEAVEETKEARRVARDVPSLQAEVARLETLLSEAGVESNEDSTIEAAAQGERPAAQGPGGVGGPRGRDRPAARRDPSTAHHPGAVPGPEGHHQDAAQGDHPDQQRGGPAGQAGPPVEQNASTGSSRGRRASGGPLGSCPARTCGSIGR